MNHQENSGHENSEHKNGGSVHRKPWTLHAANLLENSESVVLVVIGVALVLVAVLLLYSSIFDLNEALRRGAGEIENKAIGILNTVLLGDDDHGDRVHGGDHPQVTYAEG